MSDEVEWRPVPDTDGWYEVSSDGRVRSWMTQGRGAARRTEPLILKAPLDRDGYPRLILRQQGRGRNRTVHGLVCQAFLGPCPDGMQIRHLDGNPANSRLENLCYGTGSENCADRIKHGTAPRGSNHYKHLLTEGDVRDVLNLYRGGMTQIAIAQLKGVTRSAIGDILCGNSWGWLTGFEPRRRAA